MICTAVTTGANKSFAAAAPLNVRIEIGRVTESIRHYLDAAFVVRQTKTYTPKMVTSAASIAMGDVLWLTLMTSGFDDGHSAVASVP